MQPVVTGALGRLIAQSPTARVLVNATARPEFTPPWPARSNLTTLQLASPSARRATCSRGSAAGSCPPTRSTPSSPVPTAKEVAQRAAVLGREFSYPMLAAVAGLGDTPLPQGLA